MRVTISAPVLASVSQIDSREAIHQFFDGVKTLVETLDISADDKRLALTAPKGSLDLRLNINGRLVYALSAVQGGFRWLFMLREQDLLQINPDYAVEARRRFSGKDGMFLYETYSNELTKDGYEQLLFLCIDACQEYLPTQSGSRFRNSHRPELYEMAMDAPLRDEVIVQSVEEELDQSHPFEHLIEVYKDLIQKDRNEPGRYKWICTETFQRHWNIDASDFSAMLKAALRDRAHLLHHNSASFILSAAQHFPEIVREMFRHLFDESKALTVRLRAFTRAADALRPKLEQARGKKPAHLQDERTMAFYLAMRFPQNYPLYRPDIYELLLRTIVLNPTRAVARRKASERFLHFLELGRELLPFIEADDELQSLVAGTLTDACWKGPQQWLIFGDILGRNKNPVAVLQEPTLKAAPYEALEPLLMAAEAIEAYAPPILRSTEPLNTIFYGPPGTGKTYTTPEAAVKRAEPAFRPEGNSAAEQHESYRRKYEALVEEGRIAFVTFHQSLSYEDFIEGIKPQEPGPDDAFLSYHVRDGIFKELALRAAANPKAHVLIIDEINRGNVSRVFGELITLIEEDKRTGGKEAVELTLPYSGEPFSVPSNLYIIGTMNTADRSVEALDTALRRRFSFIEMPPREELIEGAVRIHEKDYRFSEILRTINARMEALAGRDHKIGHSYFLNLGDDWKAYLRVFTDKIIPLLQEYFYGDYSRMCLVLGSGFVTVTADGNPTKLFAKLPFNSLSGDPLSTFQEKEIWTLTDWEDATEEQFAAALDALLNG